MSAAGVIGASTCTGGSWGGPPPLPQLTTSLVAIWDDVLPPLPDDVWQQNVAAVKAALGA